MGTTAKQIETDIERTRATLGSNIQELEHKVKTATDWRHHYRKNPLPMLGLAFGGGVLLSAMIGRRKSCARYCPTGKREATPGGRRRVREAKPGRLSTILKVL